MSVLREIRSWFGRVQETTDAAFMAAAFAEAGEPELALETMLRAERDRNCCGAVPAGGSCERVELERCTLALGRA